MSVTWVSPEVASVLYAELAAKAPRLIEEGGWATSVEFVWWSRQEPIYLVRWAEGFAMVIHWYRGLSAEIHPVFLDWRQARGKLAQYMKDLFIELDVNRLVFRMKWPSKSLKRHLAQIGAKFEGTERQGALSSLGGTQHLIDVDIWAILCQDLEDKHGNGTDTEDR